MKSLGFPYSSKNRHTAANSSANSDQSKLFSYPQPRSTSPSRSPARAQNPKSSFAASTPSLTARATALFKHPARVQSNHSFASDSASGSASLHRSHEDSTRSDSKLSLNADTQSYPIVHPFAAMVAAPVPVVSSHDSDDEDACPVCLEPLSFSFRLPGEKPHIVPDCGHALHEVRDVCALSHSTRSLEDCLYLRPASPPFTGHHRVRVGTEASRGRRIWVYVGCVEGQ